MYMCSAALKRYEGQGRNAADAPLLHWAIWDALYKAQTAMDGVIANYPNKLVGWLLRRAIYPLGAMFHVPSDDLGRLAARMLIEPSTDTHRGRERLTAGMFIPAAGKAATATTTPGDAPADEPLATLEAALGAALGAEAVEAKLRAAEKGGMRGNLGLEAWIAFATDRSMISATEAGQLRRFEQLRARVVEVDHFPQDFERSALALQK
jgi:acyl-CoA dehydrogenase